MKCEWRQDVSLYVDDELEPARQQEVAAHLRRCPECAAAVMEHTELKKAVRVAGRQFSAPPQLRAGIRESLRSADARPPLWRWSFVLLSIVAVAMLGFVLFSIPRRINPEIAELVDQHITTLASASPVDVVSSDRHTVKPWFQGKLPFSFNLPELANSRFSLAGGKVVYLGQAPGAELLYEVSKHKISIFVFQARGNERPAPPSNHNLAFTVNAWSQGGLRCYLVTDASKEDASQLASMFQAANRI